MNAQMTLSGFESPHAKELAAYEEMLPQLQEAARSAGGNGESIAIKHGKSYSSVWFASLLAFRLCLRKSKYIEVPDESKDVVADLAPLRDQKKAASGFWRVSLDDTPIAACSDILGEVIKAAIDRMPKEWDCCSRYEECSNAKACIHPDKEFALACGYRKILNSGRVFYGKNRNV